MTNTFACARHGEPTRLRCVSCDTPICPRCLVRTDVGLRCEDCGRPAALPARAARVPGRVLAMAAGAAVVVVAVGVVLLRPSTDEGSGPASAVQEVDVAGAWEKVAPLTAIRGSTAAVVLNDGTVLVAGGGVSAIPVAAVEVFDPATGSWRSVASMAQARRGHRAALLGDGRVLVAGGVASSGALTSAEVFDPATGTWAGTGPMTTARLGHALTVLPDGRVLAAGGSSLGQTASGSGPAPLASTEVYDPATGRWSAGPSMATPRFEHTATALAGGRVLVAGGSGQDGTPVASAEIFDPVAGVFVEAASLAEARTNHAAAELADHRVLVVGGVGGNRGDTALRSAEIFDPERSSWTKLAPMSKARAGATATALSNGVLVAGGEAVDGGARKSLADTEVFDAATGRWRPGGTMACPRSEHAAAALLNGDVLIVAGDGAFPGQPPVAQGCADRFRPAAG